MRPLYIALNIVNLSLFFRNLDVVAFQPSFCRKCASIPGRCHNFDRIATHLSASLTPIGPFSPFRSSAAAGMDTGMEQLSTNTPDFATAMTSIQLDLQLGQTPDPDRLLKLADAMEEAVEKWEELMARLRLSEDFQMREYAKLTQAHLEKNDVSIETVAFMMKWQGNCMRAMAENKPPPMPPPDINFEEVQKIMQQQQQQAESGSGKGTPSISGMSAAMQITAAPFTGDESVFQQSIVKDEYETLCRDHSGLIDFGAKYSEFDPLGKIRYLDEIEKIEERWDVFFARFSLMGALNKEWASQCDTFLESMGMDEQEYRELLKKSHQIMRDEAERERSQLGL